MRTNVLVEQLLLCIQEILGSILSQHTVHSESICMVSVSFAWQRCRQQRRCPLVPKLLQGDTRRRPICSTHCHGLGCNVGLRQVRKATDCNLHSAASFSVPL